MTPAAEQILGSALGILPGGGALLSAFATTQLKEMKR
jgi:TctA family transporter